ncbi:hypothetical protein [Nitrosopumilus sp.]|uniref:hypothetical protein n=1 Tax=Nitrosopumilus sp. TaxID=2024843 RepID=UPI00292E4E36|nr:hypothetical protein [Nitrosopumilus sp.]
MNKTTTIFSLVIALAAVFAIASPFGVAAAQTNEAMPDGEEGEKDYKDGEHKEGRSCPSKERTLQQPSITEQFS